MRQRGNKRAGSIWEDQSKVYWEKHEKNKKNSIICGIILLVGISVGTAVHFGSTSTTSLVRPSENNSTMNLTTEAQPIIDPILPTVRLECKEKGIQSGWHQSSCENICERHKNSMPRPLLYRSCMDGCTFGTITASTSACESGNGDGTEKCPIVVDCPKACSPYEDQMPRPTLRKTCESSCHAIVHASCLRSLTLLHQLFTNSKANT